MKLIVLTVAALAACSASVIDPSANYKEGDRYIYFPDGDGELHLVDLQEEIDYQAFNSLLRNPDDNDYRLFTRRNPTSAQSLIHENAQSLLASNFVPSNPTVVIAHGWNSHGESSINGLCVEAFLMNDDYNVIVMDWSRMANRNYVTAKNGVPAIGRGLGHFLIFLANHGASFDTMHLVGFSLGAHLIGNAGREVGGRVKRLTGLDPAGPLWSNDVNKIQPADGQFVEIMHTNSGTYGLDQLLGDVDFWPNGGSSMPGCWLNTCSHSKAYEYFAASVKYNHLLATECGTIRDAQRNNCNLSGQLEMGNDNINKSGSGIFRVDTARNYPF